MSRYLTPSTIGLIALAVVYTDLAVPPAAIIPFLSFITTRILQQPPDYNDAHSPDFYPSSPPTLSDIEDAIGGLESTMPGRSLHDAFLDKLWDIDSLHAFHDFFRNLANIVSKSRTRGSLEVGEDDERKRIVFSRGSPIGSYVRRAQLEFTRLQFDDTIKLWISFIKFRQPTENLRRKRRHSVSTPILDSNFAALDLPDDSELPNILYSRVQDGNHEELDMSTEEMDRLLEFQLEKLQSMPIRPLTKSLLTGLRKWRSSA
jgi:anaphase-promoting complex subunit 5